MRAITSSFATFLRFSIVRVWGSACPGTGLVSELVRSSDDVLFVDDLCTMAVAACRSASPYLGPPLEDLPRGPRGLNRPLTGVCGGWLFAAPNNDHAIFTDVSSHAIEDLANQCTVGRKVGMLLCPLPVLAHIPSKEPETNPLVVPIVGQAVVRRRCNQQPDVVPWHLYELISGIA